MTPAIVHKAPYSLPVLAACLGPGKTHFSLYYLSKSNYARFSLLTLDIGTVTYLEKVVSQLGEATAFHPCCVWPTYSFQELLKNKEVLLNNKLIFCHRVNYLLC